MKTSELTGAALDWAVAKCEYKQRIEYGGYVKQWVLDDHAEGILHGDAYSTDWAQGGPIIDRERYTFASIGTGPYDEHGNEPIVCVGRNSSIAAEGSTHLIAAMRCYVINKLGTEINIPERLK